MAKKDIIKKKKNEVIREAKIEKSEDDSKASSIVIIITVVIISLLVIGGLFLHFGNKESNKGNKVTDGEKFEKEYEDYNGKDTTYGGKYLEIDFSSDNGIKYTSYEEVFDILEDGTGVIYFGFPTCPWCRNLVPVLLDAKDMAGVDTIYYFNNSSDRDVKELDEDGNIVTKREGSDNYYKLIEKLDSVLGEYDGLNDSSIKRLYYPTVIFVKEGKIVDFHIGTVDSQENPSIFLNDDQYNELKDTLVDKMLKIIVCDDAC